jgi:transcriptional regulator with XRE-family HTH domain
MTHDARDQEASFYYELFRQRLWVVLEDLPDTRKDIATAIGVSPQSLSNYVNDTETPKLHTLAKLCLRYRVSAAWLLLGDKADLPFAKAENWARAVEDRLAASRAAPAPAGEAPRAKAKGTKHRISRAS